LQHGSILLDGSQEIIAAVSRKPQVASAVTTLSAELGRPVSFDEVADAITSTILHPPPPSSPTLHSDLAPVGIAVKS
jgi:lipoate-protein ligase A